MFQLFYFFFRRCTPRVRSSPVPSGWCEDTETSLRLSPLSGLLFSGLKEKVSEFGCHQSVFLWLPVVFPRSHLLDPGLVFNRLISHDLPLSLVFVSASFMPTLLPLSNSAVIICLASDVYFVSVLFKLSEQFSISRLLICF